MIMHTSSDQVVVRTHLQKKTFPGLTIRKGNSVDHGDLAKRRSYTFRNCSFVSVSCCKIRRDEKQSFELPLIGCNVIDIDFNDFYAFARRTVGFAKFSFACVYSWSSLVSPQNRKWWMTVNSASGRYDLRLLQSRQKGMTSLHNLVHQFTSTKE